MKDIIWVGEEGWDGFYMRGYSRLPLHEEGRRLYDAPLLDVLHVEGGIPV